MMKRKEKRTLHGVLTLMLMLGLMLIPGLLPETACATGGNPQIVDGVYQIEGYADLKAFAEIVNGKEGQDANRAACAVLKADIEAGAGDWIFTGRMGQRILGNSFNKHLGLALDALGMRHRSSHKLRKTYGTELHEGGADDTTVQRQLGHKDIATTIKWYIHGNRSRKRQRQQVEDAISF